jgi:hypothetical protein
MDLSMPAFAPVQPHGSFTEVFPDVFQLQGTIRFATLLSITRNMTVVRQGGELVVLNSVRLSPEGEAELEKLGKVTHVVRVGAFHGLDDPYYVDRWKATLWGPPGTQHGAGLAGRDLTQDECPLPGARVFLFQHTKQPEAAIVLDREGGVLIPCDSYQNWTTFEGCSVLGGLMMRALDFRPTVIGGPWMKRVGSPEVRADFERLLEVPFAHLLPAHGTTLRDRAREGLRTAVAHRFA